MKLGGIGTAAGFALGGPVGGALGAQLGFGLDAAGESEAAQRGAQSKYDTALRDYSSGTQRANDQAQGEYQRLAGEQLKSQSKAISDAPTGQQSANQLGQTYAGALQGASQAAAKAPPIPVTAHGGLNNLYKAGAATRAQAEFGQQAHAIALGQVQQTAQQAAMTHQLDQMKLNQQLAYVANVSGVEKAQLAARFAMATGQYPLDVANASKAGGKNALISGAAGGALNLGTSVASAFKAGGRQEKFTDHTQYSDPVFSD